MAIAFVLLIGSDHRWWNSADSEEHNLGARARSAARTEASQELGTAEFAEPAKQENSYALGVESDVLLADSEYDRDRVAMLITRTTDEADELELRLLPGRDQPLSEFERNLMAEEVDENES